MDKIKMLEDIINNSDNIVFFGGAGVSTKSDIPDFRSNNGLEKYNFEEILSHSFFMNNTKEFYDFYLDKMVYLNAKPNYCHEFLTKLEKKNKLKGIITQNIDSLHQKAHSKNVYELHGTIYENYCIKCNKDYNIEDIINNGYICECGGIIKPNVVLYGESLDNEVLNKSIDLIENADTLIVAGTSLVVYPAASLIRYFRGKNLILINKDKTSYDNIANLVINDDICDTLKKITIK